MSVELVTFGCRLNVVESEAIKHAAEAAGQDDLVIVNTCAVTSEAVRQARQTIRKLKRERPTAKIVVTGCAAQIEPERFAEMAEVSSVIGNESKTKQETWAALSDPASGFERVRVSDIMAVKELSPHLVSAFEGHTRSFVEIQNGCDHRCTFCIIPYGRGNSRSVPMGAVTEQIAKLVDAGHKEAVLTGVDLTSYGADLPGTPKLGALVKSILRHVPDLKRLRLSSIDSVEADDDLIDAIATEQRLMPHLHLSLQSGDDLILKRMKRRHLRANAIRFCNDIRRQRPDIAFGADIIAGFPTETEEMFQHSLDLVDECGLAFLHVFPYSPRPGTPAAKMPQVKGDVIKKRARRLREKGEAALQAHLEHLVGTKQELLIERGGIGRTSCFTPVRVGGGFEAGSLVSVRIREYHCGHLKI
ncbi:MAG: tRNA (N(6)-L-threonylcarbamoyladenosine(37)-C(2))-methylthiotransferase MtaB [Beijerinckiaceae bacterium]|nr:tRNA (N(6)-L-threonylcarbamoyladenosine(37)-C(2))-methylthiotransferase MtaB [Beijerinckiaceae bacterium]